MCVRMSHSRPCPGGRSPLLLAAPSVLFDPGSFLAGKKSSPLSHAQTTRGRQGWIGSWRPRPQTSSPLPFSPYVTATLLVLYVISLSFSRREGILVFQPNTIFIFSETRLLLLRCSRCGPFITLLSGPPPLPNTHTPSRHRSRSAPKLNTLEPYLSSCVKRGGGTPQEWNNETVKIYVSTQEQRIKAKSESASQKTWPNLSLPNREFDSVFFFLM